MITRMTSAQSGNSHTPRLMREVVHAEKKCTERGVSSSSTEIRTRGEVEHQVIVLGADFPCRENGAKISALLLDIMGVQ